MRAARIVAALALLAWASAPASAAGPCPAPPDGAGRAVVEGRDLADGELRVVCLGSSSTQGVGASSPGLAYPAQLQALLAARLPGTRVEVVNRGVGGETVGDNLRRLERDVLAQRPDLVVWQVGTNDALRGLPLEAVRAQIEAGLRRLKGAGASVVLMDSQPLPAERGRAVAGMSAAIAGLAAETRTPLFPRHELMLGWLRSGALTPATAYARDGLHMADASYRCLAEALAGRLLPPSSTALLTLAAPASAARP